MTAIRHFLAQRRLAMLLCSATLLLKLLVPTGYMIGTDHGRVAITECPGTMLQPMTAAMASAMPGMHGDAMVHGTTKGHGKHEGGRAEMPCAFAGLSAAVLHTIDPVQLAALLAFVLALGMVATALPLPAASAHLRPPLRGPPAYR